MDAREIEITPEMIEAGTGELAWHGDWSRSDEEVVARIYRVMALARLPKADRAEPRDAVTGPG
jgi:hypothetical protein